MSIAQKKKKQPDLVRRQLMDSAALLAAEQGAEHVTLSAVAAASGVTKGGLLYHFASKRELFEAVFTELVARTDNLVESIVSAGPGGYGTFTRAYIQACLMQDDTHDTILSLLLSYPSLQSRWASWYESRMKQHMETDCDDLLEIVRYAVDGARAASLSGSTTPAQRQSLARNLLALSHRHG